MNIGEEFVNGRIACSVQIGPVHFFCDRHKRDSRSFKRENGQWVEGEIL